MALLAACAGSPARAESVNPDFSAAALLGAQEISIATGPRLPLVPAEVPSCGGSFDPCPAAGGAEPPLDAPSQGGRLRAGLKQFVKDYQRANTQALPRTTLRGEAIFGLETINNLERVDGEPSNGENLYVGYRLRLNLDTTFFGNDRLRVRLQSRTLPELESITGTPLTNLSFDGDTLGRVEISDLWYRFSIGKETEINITAAGGSLRDNVPVVNPLFYGSSRGSISVFGSEDPIIRSGSGSGLGVSHDFSKVFNVSAAYIARRAERADAGLFGDRYASIVQLTYLPKKNELAASLAFTYSLNDGFLRDQFENAGLVRGGALSGEVYYRPFKHLALGLRGGLIEATALDLQGAPMKQIASYALSVGFPDLFRKSDLLGVIVGCPPGTIFDSEGEFSSAKPAHYEVFYRFPISDVMSLTPGGMYIEAPDTTGGLIGYWIGALRLTMQF